MHRGPKPLIIDGKPFVFRGRTVYEIAGGSEPAPEVQPQGQQNTGEIPDLLEPTDDDADDNGDGGTGGEQQPAWAESFATNLMQRVTSEIDRRLNTPRVRGRQQQQPEQQGQGQPQPAPSGPASADVREARAVFRDEIRDERLTKDERELAMQIAAGLIPNALQDDSDPYNVGASTAREVGAQIKRLRKSHQDAIVTQLERSGALDRSKLVKGPAGNKPGSEQKSPLELFAQGADIARQMQTKAGLRVPENT